MGLPDDEGGETRAPTPLLCAECLKEGLPPSLARIGDTEEVYANEDGEPCCSTCGFLHNLTAMDRRGDALA